jgi:hypothetical protein
MPLQIPPGPHRAYLFDMDGTIADSMPLHYIAWKQALAEYGCPDFPEDLFYSWGGMPVAAIIATLNQRFGLSMPVEEVAHRKESLYYQRLPNSPPSPKSSSKSKKLTRGSPSLSSPAPRANPSPPRSASSASSTNSTSWSAPATTKKPSPTPSPFSSPRKNSTSRRKPASSSKTRTWASRPPPRRHAVGPHPPTPRTQSNPDHLMTSRVSHSDQRVARSVLTSQLGPAKIPSRRTPFNAIFTGKLHRPLSVLT